MLRNRRSAFTLIELLKPNGKIVSRASFVIEAGKPGAKPA